MEKVFVSLTNGGPINVYVEDGVVTRIRPLQVPENEYPKAWEIEADGRTYSPDKAMRCSPCVHAERDRLYSDNRIMYPMKRVDYDPNGERNPQNRGISGYERISWEEALDIVGGKMKSLIDTEGGHAITGITSSHHNWGIVGYKMGPFNRFMNMIHYTPILDNPDSWEGWHWGATHTYGYWWRLGMPEPFDMLTDALQNTEMIVHWSADPDTTHGTYSGQESQLWRVWLKEKGVINVFIDPFFNYTNAAMDGTWFPVLPGGDVALAMAISYVWIEENTYDQEYIDRLTVGFDAFKEMILGNSDGIVKTPEWAEEKCGIEARRIRGLARMWAKCRTSLNGGARGGEGSACRASEGTEWARMMVLLQAMQGLGKPGVSIWGTGMGAPADYTWFPAYAEPEGQMGKTSIAKYKHTPQSNPTKQALYRLTYPDAVVDGEGKFDSTGFCGNSLEQQFVQNSYPIEGEVKMLYRYGGSFMGTMTETNRWVKMYRSDKFEMVVNQDCWFGSEARFADIILPACTNLERDDIGEWAACGGYTTNSHCGTNWRILVREMKCIEPVGESKSDYEILTLLAEKLGMEELFTEGKSEIDWCKAFFDHSDVAKKGYVTWEALNEKGYFIIPAPDNYEAKPGMRWFYEERSCDTPDMGSPMRGTENDHRLGTDSGKIEFESQSLQRLAFPDDERKPVPRWAPSWEGKESELYSKYPLQIISPHPRFSFHTHYDNHAQWLNEIPGHRININGYAYWPVRINPADALARGIKHGEIVELYNDRGSVLGASVVTDRVPKGVIHSYGCSAKYDPVDDSLNATDRAGCVNILTSKRFISKRAPGMAPNSCLCEVRVWEGDK